MHCSRSHRLTGRIYACDTPIPALTSHRRNGRTHALARVSSATELHVGVNKWRGGRYRVAPDMRRRRWVTSPAAA
jgi:hypothetical protein